MKTFLNVIGAIALLLAPLIVLFGQSAIHEIEAGIALLVACTCIGLAKIVEGQTESHRILDDHGKVLVKILVSLEDAAAKADNSLSSVTPSVPGMERYFVSHEGKAVGPHGIAALQSLFTRGLLTKDSAILKVGDTEWQKFGDVFDT